MCQFLDSFLILKKNVFEYSVNYEHHMVIYAIIGLDFL
jgi:hypothetical protein